MRRALAPVLAGLVALAGCATPEVAFDYGPYLDHMPRSILVLPPLDTTPEVGVTYGWLSSITLPLVERGYYVFPVAMVDGILKENGLPTPGEMHQISLAKVREVFGADAVLYVTVTSWGTEYQVINSATEVSLEARLVDVASGTEIWRGRAEASENSSAGSSDIFGMLANALVDQIVSSTYDPEVGLASDLNYDLVHDPDRGLLLGPYHPDFAKDQEERRAKRATPPGGPVTGEAAAKAR
jgi:hypothetical protein